MKIKEISNNIELHKVEDDLFSGKYFSLGVIFPILVCLLSEL